MADVTCDIYGMTRLYLAYGSNLHPVRLLERVPSARVVGTTRLDRYQVVFMKRSRDGSSKASLLYTDEAHHTAYACVYELASREKPVLDAIEGVGAGYDTRELQVPVNGEVLDVFTYVAAATHASPGLAPYDWYHTLVTAGALHHGFPADYVAALKAVTTQPDRDPQRRAIHEALIERVARYRD